MAPASRSGRNSLGTSSAMHMVLEDWSSWRMSETPSSSTGSTALVPSYSCEHKNVCGVRLQAGHPVKNIKGTPATLAAMVLRCGRAACSARAWCCKTWTSSTRARKGGTSAKCENANAKYGGYQPTSSRSPACKAPPPAAPVRRQARRIPERVDVGDRIPGLVVPSKGKAVAVMPSDRHWTRTCVRLQSS